jgi:preprotein translocase subunit SecG
MSFIAGILTVLLILSCVLLVLLVLVQLPKKDAGAGIAFGGGTADALFGAGSGNVLTKITKWTAGIFFALSLILAGIEEKIVHSNGSSAFQNAVQQQQQQSQMPAGVPPGTTATPTTGNPVSLPAIPTNPTNGAPTTPPSK